MKSTWKADQQLYLVLVIFVLTLFSRVFTSLIGEYLGTNTLSLVWVICHLTILILFISKGGKIKISFFYNHVGLLIALSFASVLWSDNIISTLKASLMVLSTVFVTHIMVREIEYEEIMMALLHWFIVLLVLGYILFLIWPDLVVMHGNNYTGQFKSVFNHKNYFGRISIVLLIITLSLMQAGKLNIGKTIMISIFLIFGVLVSNSAGALLILVGVLVTYFFLNFFQWTSLNKLLLSCLALLLIVLSLMYFDVILSFVGKSSTLTGRTYLWAMVLYMISFRPILGYGYGAFWDGEDSASAVIYDKTWDAPHAHNGLLDLWLDLGFVGVLVYVIGFFLLFKQAYKLYIKKKSAELLFVMLIIIFSFLANLVESQVLKQNEIMWIVYVYAMASVQNYQEKTIK